MPTYVYECRECGKVSEVEQRITADALTDCEACGAKGTLRRLIQPVAVAFKGAGFHINDYAAKGEPAAAEAKPTETVTETKAPESKPAESTPSAPEAPKSDSPPKA